MTIIGWIYAVNFSFIDEGVAIKGSLHFARRRTLQRHRDFHGNHSHNTIELNLVLNFD